jgi:hypothetical protein
MTVGKKMISIGGKRVVEIDTDIRKLAKDRRGKAELRLEEIAGALMGQDHSHAARCFFTDSAEDEADDFDRWGSRLSGAGSIDGLSTNLAASNRPAPTGDRYRRAA